MASIKWEPNVGQIVYGEVVEESIFSARAIYQDADGDDYSPDGTYTYTYSGGTLAAGTKLDSGVYTLTVTFDPTDASLGSNITGTASLTVEKATPVVVWNNPPSIKYTYDGSSGPKLSVEQLSATADVAGEFTYSPAIGTELSAGLQTVTAIFVPTDIDNYKSLPQDGDILQIEFEVLRGDIQIDWGIFENGVFQEIRTPDGTVETPYVLDFPDAKAQSLGNDIPGSFSYSPDKGAELTESTNITAVFTPVNAANWNTAEVTLPFTVFKRVSGPDIAPTMFGCYVQSVSASVGWGGTSSTCSLRLIEDPGNGYVWTPPDVGAACYFKYRGFEFGGVFVRWSYSDSTSGRYYDIILESPAKLLDGVQVIMDSFEGTEYNYDEGNEYNRFRPSSVNPNITTEVNNVYNALGHFENHTFEFEGKKGIFGAAQTNSAGFLANKLLETIEILSCPEENPTAAFAHKCAFGSQEFFKIDLSEIKNIAPDFYRVQGVTQSVNGVISDVTELVQNDYFVTLEPDSAVGRFLPPVKGAEGDDGGGLIENPNIKIKAISKGAQPSAGVIRSLVNDFKERELLISSSIGQELTDDTTQKIVLGGPGSRLVTRDLANAFPIWAKLQDSSYVFDFGPSGSAKTTSESYQDRNKVPVWVDPFSPISQYAASIFELRMARGGRNSWQTFKVFESVANGEYNDPQKAPWCVDMDIDEATLNVLKAGTRGALHLASTSKISAQKSFNTDFQNNFNESVEEYVDKLFAAVQNTANNFYGKMFALPMPTEPGGIDNNIRFITEDQKYETSWEAVDSAFDPGGAGFRFNDIAMFDSNGRTKTYVEWRYTSERDFSKLGSNYAGYSGRLHNQNFDKEDTLQTGGQGVASNGCSIEKSAIFYRDRSGDFMATPFVVMNAGQQILEYDSKTTTDFGLTVLADYFFGIKIPPQNYIGPGKANTKIAVPPRVITPRSFGIAQQSNRYVWGPWIGGSLKGKAEVIQDESLVPESFGTVSGMNQAGEALANVGNAEMSGSETGYVEIAEFPAYNIAERFAGSGPYVSDMSFTIDISGFKTTYKFNTWTPQFGKLAKYNIDRIARINKASLELAQRERAKIQKRALLPPPPPLTAEDLLNRLNRQDISLSLGQIFPPQGDLDGTWSISDISTSDIGGTAENGGIYDRVAGASRDNNFVPVHISKDKSKNENMPSLEKPQVEGEEDGEGILPNSKTSDPFFSTEVNEDDGTKTFERNTSDGLIVDTPNGPPDDFSPDKMTEAEKKSVTAVRTVADSLPKIAAGWGHDIAFNPVPNDGEDLRKFDPKFQNDPALRKAGPVRLLWDEERKIWVGGPEIICGILDSEITAPPSPLEPTTFTIKVLRKTKSAKGSGALSESGEKITCYNRDSSLSQEKQDKDTFVMVIRVNYEWMPLWVGCPDSGSSS